VQKWVSVSSSRKKYGVSVKRKDLFYQCLKLLLQVASLALPVTLVYS